MLFRSICGAERFTAAEAPRGPAGSGLVAATVEGFPGAEVVAVAAFQVAGEIAAVVAPGAVGDSNLRPR